MAQRHHQILAEMAKDPETCQECGGWLGRKAGTKPFCTSPTCPGRFCSKDPTPPPPPSVESPLLKRTEMRATFSDISRATPALKPTPTPAVQPTPAAKPAPTPTPAAKPAPSSSAAPARSYPATQPDKQRNDVEAARIKSDAAPSSSAVDLRSRAQQRSYTESVIYGTTPSSASQSRPALIVTSPTPSPEPRRRRGAPQGPTPECIQWTAELLTTAQDYSMRLFAGFVTALTVLSMIALLMLPMIPQPGTVDHFELCFDLGSPAIRFDRSLVHAGPCFGLDLEFAVSGHSAPVHAPPPPPPIHSPPVKAKG